MGEYHLLSSEPVQIYDTFTVNSNENKEKKN